MASHRTPTPNDDDVELEVVGRHTRHAETSPAPRQRYPPGGVSTSHSPLLPVSGMGHKTPRISQDGGEGGDSGKNEGKPRKNCFILVLSYISDWVILILFGGISWALSGIEPIKRPFSLDNATISFPFQGSETVPVRLLFVVGGVLPFIAILLIVLVLVPGPTVPKGTPRSLIWKRKLWELHTGFLGFGLAVVIAMFVTNGLKNMYGKPRPDLISRCMPDPANQDIYRIGSGLLVTHEICTQTDRHKLADGFRSWPSGHSSFSAATMIYLSLFIASKFTITIPFVVTPTSHHSSSSDGFQDASLAAFPSRSLPRDTSPLPRDDASGGGSDGLRALLKHGPDVEARISSHSRAVLALRRQAAAPPLYLFAISLLPFFAAVYISSSRWFDYRHHAFDIFSGFLIGALAAILGFRWYHMPVSQGAGWAWGPRSVDKAFWAGVGSYSFATPKRMYYVRPDDEEDRIESVGNDGGAHMYGYSGSTMGAERIRRKPTPGSTSPRDTVENRDDVGLVVSRI